MKISAEEWAKGCLGCFVILFYIAAAVVVIHFVTKLW